jgi:ElaB/YqjD/DUF883 family membrane-anchored ribosome-binding protein
MERKTPAPGYRSSKFSSSEESDTVKSDVTSLEASNEDFASGNVHKSAGMASDSMNEDIQSLKTDLASLKESIASLTSSAATTTMGMASDAASKVSETVSDAASVIAEKSSNMASVATKGAQSLSVEVEDLTRRNPLAALAGAVVLGLLIGMASRGRS